MYSRVNYTIVGFFVLLFGIGVVWFGFWLGKYGKKDEYKTYQTYISESVSGLSKDSVVMLHGVSVGFVDGIYIDKSHIQTTQIILKIKKDIPITTDMVATTQMMGITGLLGIDIQGGSSDAPLLKASSNETIPTIKSQKSWVSSTKETLISVSKDVKVISEQLKKLLDEQNVKHIQNILQNVDSASAKLDTTLDDINSSITVFKASLQHMDSNFSSAIEDFHSMQQNFDKLTNKTLPVIDNISQTTKDFDRATLSFSRSLKRGDYNIKRALQPTLIDIENLSSQVADLIENINNNPNALLFQSRKLKKGPGE
jgi:phospholipid/cholesterol/gamma-HCH transport system substrate-binding protein